MFRLSCSLLLCTTFLAVPALADHVSPGPEEIPNVMIARVPAVGEAKDLRDQRIDTDVEVFLLRVEVKRLAEGSLDTASIREQVLDLMATVQPITVKISNLEGSADAIPDEAIERLQEAEADSVAAYEPGAKPVVAWRGYGPYGGARSGVIAFHSNPYRGYYPYSHAGKRFGTNPYLGFYANGRNYPFTYAVYRNSPSYHFFAYSRFY